MYYLIDESVCSSIENARGMLKCIMDRVKRIIPDEAVLFDIRLILDELVYNGVKHGNEFKEEKKIKIRIEITDDFVKIEVCDEGTGIKCRNKEYNPLDLKDCGRGLVLVKGLSDEFSVDKNKAVSIKYIK